MRSRLAKEVRKQFGAGLDNLDIPFRKISTELEGATLYSCQVASSLTLYLALMLNRRYDHFDVFISWRSDHEAPDTSGELAPPEAPHCPLVYISDFWGGRKADFWWELAPAPSFDRPESFFEQVPLEQCILKVSPAVDDALSRIKQHVIPYFVKVAEVRGLTLPGNHK